MYKQLVANVEIDSGFWKKYIDLVIDTVIPYQYEALNDRIEGAEPSYAIQNLRIAARDIEGKYNGMVFQDSDLYKWIEAAAYTLKYKSNDILEKRIDEIACLLEKAQLPDGYLNTFYIVNDITKRWTNLCDCHELYCIGHLIEASVAYYESTSKDKLLNISCKAVDNICDVFGNDKDKLKGYPGHQEIELALIKLYNVTKNEKYLELSKFFIYTRGTENPNYFIEEWKKNGKKREFGLNDIKPMLEYNQCHVPVYDQKVAVGHSVRAVYMYTAMADIARITKDEKLINACKELWDNITQKQMYITGGIGSTNIGEAFTFDYDMPNDTIYAETCASIGLLLFANRMSLLEQKSEYADIIEKILYNIVIASMAQDGKHYFYVNPLEVFPKASKLNPTQFHVKPERQPWFGCSCCPPNVARILASLHKYIYSVTEDTVYVSQFIDSSLDCEIAANNINIKQNSELPWKGNIKLNVLLKKASEFKLALRIPSWNIQKPKLMINGKEIAFIEKSGYAIVDRIWENNDVVDFEVTVEVIIMESNPLVKKNIGKVAIQRGPLIYCLEEVDNFSNINEAVINLDTVWKETSMDISSLEVVALMSECFKSSSDMKTLYNPVNEKLIKASIFSVPYFVWANRGENEMIVWIRKK